MILIGFYLILFIYTLFIGTFIYGFNKMKSMFSDNKPKTSFSIVIPFRNEAENLPILLQLVSCLDYPKELIEVILVDDDSKEEFSMTNYELSIISIKNVRNSNSPKKDAINTAIAIANKEWIITTDADCMVQSNWLKIIDSYIQTENKRMVAAGVKLLSKNGFLYEFQNLDFLSLQGVTIGSFGIKKPFMCNGANFAYEKSFFKELNGFEGNSEIASGDDVFLLQKAIQYEPQSVGFCKNTLAVVFTKSEWSWKTLFFQRVRWASKSSVYVDGLSRCLAMLVFLTNLLFVIGFCLWIMHLFTYENLLLYFGIKFLVDAVIILQSAEFFNQRIRYLLISSIIYPFFSSAVAVYALFGKYEWKGRTFKS